MNTVKRQAFSLMVLLTLSVTGIALTASPAAAQTSTYMFVEGIKGSVTEARHVNWINVASFGQSASNAAAPTYAAGTAAPRVVGACDLEIFKGLDASGPHLWLALFQGKSIPDVRLEVWMTRPAGDQVQVYGIKLRDVVITSITAASTLTYAETVKLSGGRIELTVNNFNSSGVPLGQVTTNWDCKANMSR